MLNKKVFFKKLSDLEEIQNNIQNNIQKEGGKREDSEKNLEILSSKLEKSNKSVGASLVPPSVSIGKNSN